MTAPLDEKGLEAAQLAWTGDARLGLYPEQLAALANAIRAYLAASPSPSMEIDRLTNERDVAPDLNKRIYKHLAGEKEFIRAESAEAQVLRLTEENEALRNVVSECAESLMNGAAISTEASLDFMKLLPTEIQMVVLAYKARITALEEALRPVGTIALGILAEAPANATKVKVFTDSTDVPHYLSLDACRLICAALSQGGGE